jgi:hypothetical protein
LDFIVTAPDSGSKDLLASKQKAEKEPLNKPRFPQAPSYRTQPSSRQWQTNISSSPLHKIVTQNSHLYMPDWSRVISILA